MFLTGDATFARSASRRSSWSPSRCSARSPSCLRCSRSSATRSTGCASRSSAGAAADDGEGRIWGAIVDRVLRRPVLSAVLAGGLLLALAAPALQLHMATPGPDTFPQSLPSCKTYKRMQQAFPGTALPANVVVKAPNVNAPAVRAAIGRLEQRALASGRMYEPITVDVNKDATVANITVPIDGTGTDAASNAALAALRDEIVPRDGRRASEHARPASPGSRPSGRTHRRDEVEAAARGRRSCCCSRSRSCCSRSARSWSR